MALRSTPQVRFRPAISFKIVDHGSPRASIRIPPNHDAIEYSGDPSLIEHDLETALPPDFRQFTGVRPYPRQLLRRQTCQRLLGGGPSITPCDGESLDFIRAHPFHLRQELVDGFSKI